MITPPRTGLRALAGLVALASVAAGCAEASDASAPDVTLFGERSVAEGIAPIDPERGEVLPAPTLRLVVARLMSEHTVVAAQVIQALTEGRSDTGPAAAVMVDNTDALAGAMGLVVGPGGAEAFDQLWVGHLELFVDLAEARRDGDDDREALARERLASYEDDFSSFTVTAVGAPDSFEAVLDLLHVHVDDLAGQLDLWQAGRHADATRLILDAHAHVDVIAWALADAISADQPVAFPGPVDADDPVALTQIELIAWARATGIARRAEVLDGVPATEIATGAAAYTSALSTRTGIDLWNDVILGGDGPADRLIAALTTIDADAALDVADALAALDDAWATGDAEAGVAAETALVAAAVPLAPLLAGSS